MPEKISIHCGERLSIENVEQLYSAMEGALSSDVDIELDAADVGFCDTAGLQLLISLKREAEKTGHGVQWSAVSDNLRETSAYLGLCQSLGLNAPN